MNSIKWPHHLTDGENARAVLVTVRSAIEDENECVQGFSQDRPHHSRDPGQSCVWVHIGRLRELCYGDGQTNDHSSTLVDFRKNFWCTISSTGKSWTCTGDQGNWLPKTGLAWMTNGTGPTVITPRLKHLYPRRMSQSFKWASITTRRQSIIMNWQKLKSLRQKLCSSSEAAIWFITSEWSNGRDWKNPMATIGRSKPVRKWNNLFW